MTKLPSFQFYPGDWMKDPAVRSVSSAARGLWIDMLCLMFESPRRGYLQLASGTPVSHSQIARMTGCVSDEVSRLLQELEDAGVFSRTEHGVIYSRRLTRDEHIRLVRSNAGKKGAPYGKLGGRPKKPQMANEGQVLRAVATDAPERPKTKKTAKTAKGTPKKGQSKGQNNPLSSSSSTSTSIHNKESPSEPPFTAEFKQFIGDEYQRLRGCKLITDNSDWINLSKMLEKLDGSVSCDQLKLAWTQFLLSTDPFHQKQGHPLRYWANNINAFIGKRLAAKNGQPDLYVGQGKPVSDEMTPERQELIKKTQRMEKEAVERLKKKLGK